MNLKAQKKKEKSLVLSNDITHKKNLQEKQKF